MMQMSTWTGPCSRMPASDLAVTRTTHRGLGCPKGKLILIVLIKAILIK